MPFSVILATDQHHCLGVSNRLPWKSPEDMEYFQSTTSYHPFPLCQENKNILICGRNTWESFGRRHLPNRKLFVLTRNPAKYESYTTNSLCFFSSFDEAVQTALRDQHVFQVWVIGGRSIYLQAFHHPLCGDIYWNSITSHHDNEKEKENTIYLHNFHFTPRVSQSLAPDVISRIGTMKGVEIQYLRLMKEVLLQGETRATRNATTKSLFGRSISWDMADGFPLLTTKKMYWKGIVEELLFFIRGDTQTKKLEEKGVRIWKGNTDRAFLDANGHGDYEEGEMGPMYGYQWRHFGKPLRDPNGGGIDQLRAFIQDIQVNPTSRRHLLTTYNPAQVHEGVLYPCHSLVIQAYVSQDQRLSLKMY
jgi:dihydrofolate reductase/thymidylate synthase